jgi:hypothetical protein
MTAKKVVRNRYEKKPCRKCGGIITVVALTAYPVCNDCYKGPAPQHHGEVRHSANQWARRIRGLMDEHDQD